jgi:hypothetical protein
LTDVSEVLIVSIIRAIIALTMEAISRATFSLIMEAVSTFET